MKRVTALLVIMLVVCISLMQAQTRTVITRYISPADSLREAGDVKSAIEAYRKIYLEDSTDDNNLYNYACALAISQQNDSCFKYLSKYVNRDTSTTPLMDVDFISIKDDPRWFALENTLFSRLNLKYNNRYKNVTYAKALFRMRAKDQAYYEEINIAKEKTGRYSSVVTALWAVKNMFNKENVSELESLIAKYGWPKISEVGEQAAGGAFLIIQHSTEEKQKKYLPTIEKYCKEGEAKWESYALMYDRIQTAENKPQKYGSQVKLNSETNKWELFPLLDESKVDEWRKEMGLKPLAEYVAGWDIKFEPKKK